MVGPIISSGMISPMWDNIFAVLIGMGFGFALEGSGFHHHVKLLEPFSGTTL